MSDRKTDIEALRRDITREETAIIDLNRRLTAAIVAKQSAGTLSSELNAKIDARNLLIDRLKRLTAAA